MILKALLLLLPEPVNLEESGRYISWKW